MFLTEKQHAIMDVLIKANLDGSFCDFDELMSRVDYKTTKASMHFSIRALVNKGIVIKQPREKRRGARRSVLSPTKLGYEIMRLDREHKKTVI